MLSLFAVHTSLLLPSLSWPFGGSGVVMIISSITGELVARSLDGISVGKIDSLASGENAGPGTGLD